MNADKHFLRLSAFIGVYRRPPFFAFHFRTVRPRPAHSLLRTSREVPYSPRHTACSSLSDGRSPHGAKGTHSGSFERLAHFGTSGGTGRGGLETGGHRMGTRGCRRAAHP